MCMRKVCMMVYVYVRVCNVHCVCRSSIVWSRRMDVVKKKSLEKFFIQKFYYVKIVRRCLLCVCVYAQSFDDVCGGSIKKPVG